MKWWRNTIHMKNQLPQLCSLKLPCPGNRYRKKLTMSPRKLKLLLNTIKILVRQRDQWILVFLFHSSFKLLIPWSKFLHALPQRKENSHRDSNSQWEISRAEIIERIARFWKWKGMDVETQNWQRPQVKNRYLVMLHWKRKRENWYLRKRTELRLRILWNQTVHMKGLRNQCSLTNNISNFCN